MEKKVDHYKRLKSQRNSFEDLVKRRFVYIQTAEIYGGVAGLYDYGPIGTAIKTNLINFWRNHFLLEDDINEISCTTLVPQPVFKASGHEDRFNDFMIKDEKTNEAFRVDKLIEDVLEAKLEKPKKLTPELIKRFKNILNTIGNIGTCAEFDDLIEELKITNPSAKKNKLSKVFEFNLMFSTQIGPHGNCKAYLRPETAQCIFTNFKRLLAFNNGKLPFGSSIIGSAYRNEISPRNGLLRVREFEMAEIEYFVDPLNKHCEKFADLENLVVPIYSRQLQNDGEEAQRMSLKDAVGSSIIANSYLGYFIGRTWLFANSVGILPDCIRFRQHLSGEMAHYACDCWDMEILTSYGWIECVGIADRSAYDLTAHTIASGDKLNANRILEKPIVMDIVEYQLNKGLIGKTFKRDNSKVLGLLEALTEEQLLELMNAINNEGKYQLNEQFELTKEMFKSIEVVSKTFQEEKFVPNVIEPSFGLGRIVYAILEQSFSFREKDKKRTFFNFKPMLAPYKAVLLSLNKKPELVKIVLDIEKNLRKKGISCKKDIGSSTIGKKYARTDEMGIPFGITVDEESLKDQTITFRYSLSMEQVRMPIKDLESVIKMFINDPEYSFEDMKKIYPIFN